MFLMSKVALYQDHLARYARPVGPRRRDLAQLLPFQQFSLPFNAVSFQQFSLRSQYTLFRKASLVRKASAVRCWCQNQASIVRKQGVDSKDFLPEPGAIVLPEPGAIAA